MSSDGWQKFCQNDPESSFRQKLNGNMATSPFNPHMPEARKYPIQIKQILNPPGSDGQQIELISNFYKVDTTQKSVFQYNVQIVPFRNGDIGESSTAGSSRLNVLPASWESKEEEVRVGCSCITGVDILERLVRQEPTLFSGVQYAFDGIGNLFTDWFLPLPAESSTGSDGDSASWQALITVSNESFKVTITFVDHYDIGVEVCTLLDCMATQLPDRDVAIYVSVLNSLFPKSSHHLLPKSTFDSATSCPKVGNVSSKLFPGSLANLVKTEIGLSLNIRSPKDRLLDRSFSLFNVIQAILKPSSDSFTMPLKEELAEVNRRIRGLKIETIHCNLKYTVVQLLDKTPDEVTFTTKGGSFTIAEYFKGRYDIKVLRLPLVETLDGPTSSFLPLELVTLVSRKQFLESSRLTPAMKENLLDSSFDKPNSFFNDTTRIATEIEGRGTRKQKAFGLSVTTVPVQVTGRMLPLPLMQSASSGAPFYRAGNAPNVISFICLSNELNESKAFEAFAENVLCRARQRNLHLPDGHILNKMNITRASDLYETFQKTQKQTKSDFIIVGIPQQHKTMHPYAMYSCVKLVCDKLMGVMTACVNLKDIHPDTADPDFIDTFLDKVNGKLGGCNWVLCKNAIAQMPFVLARTMVIGIKVNDPVASGLFHWPIAVAVGSTDGFWSQYVTALRVEESTETIRKLNELIFELLEQYRQLNGYYPDSLILFRHSDNLEQFSLLMEQEIPLVQMAIEETGHQMKAIFIAAIEKHQTRFARAKPPTSIPRISSWNVPSGTVVDTIIVDPKWMTFYLKSQHCTLGTSKATLYGILQDTLNLDADEYQRMCYLACFHSTQRRGPLNLPVALHYAHLCGIRARMHAEAKFIFLMEDYPDDKIGDTFQEKTANELNDWIEVSKEMKNRLYYA